MKKFSIMLFVLMFLMTIKVQAGQFYFNLSPTISLENINLVTDHETIDKDESVGFNFKLGYTLDYDYVSLEIDYDFLEGFKGYLVNNNTISYTHIQIYTVMPMLKTSVGPDNLKSYFSTGLGYMHSDRGFTKSDLCWKLGIGFDYFFTRYLSFGGNINYVVGFGDVKYIEYYNGALSLGLSF